MHKARCGWTVPEADAHFLLALIVERIRSGDIRFEHREALIRVGEDPGDNLRIHGWHPDQITPLAEATREQG